MNYSGSCGNTFSLRSDALEVPSSTTNACSYLFKRRRLGEREGEVESRDVLHAHTVGLVEGRVSDPDPDPERSRIRWVAGS